MPFDLIGTARLEDKTSPTMQDIVRNTRRVGQEARQTENRVQRMQKAFSGLQSAVGVLGIGLGVRELAGLAIEMSELGTQVKRSSEAFTILSGGADAAAAKLNAVRNASGGAIDNLQAMNIANKATALGMADSAEQLERFTRFASISGRIMGVDTVAAMENLQLAAANLSFVRLDTLGISSDKTRKKFEELRKTMDDTQAFFEAAMSVGEERFKEFEDGALTAASSLEILRAGWQNFKQELAESNVGDVFNQAFREVGIALGGGGTREQVGMLETAIRRLQGRNPVQDFIQTAITGQDPQSQISGMRKIIDLLGEMDKAVAKQIPGAAELRDRLGDVARAAALETAPIDENEIQLIQRANEFLAANVNTITAVGDAAEVAAAKTVDLAEAARLAAENFAALEGFILNGPGQPFSPSFGAGGIGIPGSAGIRTGERNFDDMMSALRDSTDEAREQNREIGRANEEAAREAERAFKKAASETERAFEKAASEFESALSGIPGIFGTSQVTEEQLKQARMGIPQNFADNYLRRLADEVLNKKEWGPGIDINDAARRAGLGPGLSPEAILEQVRAQWASGQFFAKPENLELLDLDAIRTGLFNKGQEELGRKNIMDFLKGQGLQDVFEGAKSGALTSLGDSMVEGLSIQQPLATKFEDEIKSDKVQGAIIQSGKTLATVINDSILSTTDELGIGYRLVSYILAQFNAGLSGNNATPGATTP
jgi:hypothetical protein